MMTLDAQAVGVLDSKKLKCFMIGFAETEDGSGPALMFQRAHAFDKQDVKLGQDTYCLVTDTQATTYGGVEKCELSDGRVELLLSAKAAGNLGCDQDLTILFEPEHSEEVRVALERIFTGKTSAKKAARPKKPAPRKKAPARKKITAKKASPRKKPTKKRA